MRATGVPGDVAEAVGGFTRVMVAFGCLQILDNHMFVFFANMGYVKCVAFTSMCTSVGVHMSCTYLFLEVFQWGVQGAALVQVSRRRMNNELNFPPNFEGLVLGCIDADLRK